MKPQHGEIKLLSPEDSHKILEQCHFAHLACHSKNDIYVVPITYAYDDGYIYSHSKVGKKIEMMRANPSICIQVEEIQDFYSWRSVIAWGKFEELQGDNASFGMRALVQKVKDQENKERHSELEIEFLAQLESAVIYRMKVQKLTGRFEGPAFKGGSYGN